MKNLFVGFLGLLMAGQALAATKQFCNFTTHGTLSLAVIRYVGNNWFHEGWWSMGQSECVSIDHDGSDIWYYVKAGDGTIWNEHFAAGVNGCTTESVFKVLDGTPCTGGTLAPFGKTAGTGTVQLTD